MRGVSDGEAHFLSAQADRDVLLARIEIAEAYYRGGDSLALDMLASSSLRLYSHVIAGDLAAIDLFDDLQECAANLGIAERGQDEVQAALTTAPKPTRGSHEPKLASNSDLDAIALRQDRKSKFLLYRELQATSTKEWLVHGLPVPAMRAPSMAFPVVANPY